MSPNILGVLNDLLTEFDTFHDPTENRTSLVYTDTVREVGHPWVQVVPSSGVCPSKSPPIRDLGTHRHVGGGVKVGGRVRRETRREGS